MIWTLEKIVAEMKRLEADLQRKDSLEDEEFFDLRDRLDLMARMLEDLGK